MAAYLKLEEPIVNAELSLKNDLMGLSLLGLLISPWAALGLAISIVGLVTLSTFATVACVSVLLVAMPKLLQLLRSADSY